MGNFNRNSSYGESRGGGDRSFSDRNSGSRNSGGRGFGGPSRGGSDRRTMHEAVCADCGNTCRVPFMPTGDRPVYCSDCFEKHGNDDSRDNSRGSSRNNFSEARPQERRSFSPASDSSETAQKLDMINEKLDKILKALSANKPTKARDTDKELAKEFKKAKKDAEETADEVNVEQTSDDVTE